MCWLVFFIFSVLTVALPSGPIFSWRVASSVGITENVTQLSAPSFNTSAWYELDATTGTLMATLIANGVYDEDHLFYSNNLQDVDSNQFRVPWYYRSKFTVLKDNTRTYHTLRTNGISSRADIYVNGHLVADKNTQAGAYVGLEYDISDELLQDNFNVLLIKVYPTDYNRDFALGFVDWNPYPPDNGTGIWRDVELKKSGQVSLSNPRINTDLHGSITIHLEISNLAQNASAIGYTTCVLYDYTGERLWLYESEIERNISFVIPPGGQKKLTIHDNILAAPWWPRQWGKQRLYGVSCAAFITGSPRISDYTPISKFGFRTVSSKIDPKTNDTTFYVNNERFEVLGAGYTSDIFLRFDEDKVRSQFQYVLEMGLNTVRLEGKQEHPRLYALADEMGIMLLAGWECCDKWEGWTYNDEGSGEKWVDADYSIANLSMRHEAEMMQTHPSMLGFLIGSDFWPDDRATKIYVDALQAFNWDTPILSSASQRGAPALIGNGGMKMDGPYDWVPPNYWYDPSQRLGSAGGFGSELGAGVGTPPLFSLRRFLSPSDLSDLWKEPHKGLYHMSTNVSSFHTRSIYNTALWARMGYPTNLDDYLMKAAMMDYEATKAQFEAYSPRTSTKLNRPATGMIYWMLNNAWPSLHWNLFDYYLQPGPAYFGVKAAVGDTEHLVYDYEAKSVYLVDRASAPQRWLLQDSDRSIDINIVDLKGIELVNYKFDIDEKEFMAAHIPGLHNTTEVVLLRLTLTDRQGYLLSRNTYWVPPTLDQLDWSRSTWYHTPVSKFADLGALSNMSLAELNVTVDYHRDGTFGNGIKVTVQNKSKVPAVFIRMNLQYLQTTTTRAVAPILWSENYMTLWPGEERVVTVEYAAMEEDLSLEIDGRNVALDQIDVRGTS